MLGKVPQNIVVNQLCSFLLKTKIRKYRSDCSNASVQTYAYDIMAKGNSDWLRQVADDFILDSYFDDIVEDPGVLTGRLNNKQEQAHLKKLPH